MFLLLTRIEKLSASLASFLKPAEAPPYFIIYHTILYYAILYYTILYYTILYYTILYYTILYYTILYYTILYYTILYYTILYHTILYYTCHAMPRGYFNELSSEANLAELAVAVSLFACVCVCVCVCESRVRNGVVGVYSDHRLSESLSVSLSPFSPSLFYTQMEGEKFTHSVRNRPCSSQLTCVYARTVRTIHVFRPECRALIGHFAFD